MEGIKEEVVLSPAHALSLIASGEGTRKLKLAPIDLEHAMFNLFVEILIDSFMKSVHNVKCRACENY